MQLKIENLQVSYDKIKALHGISFEIDQGEIVTIIGANGAGKSTTLRAISRLVTRAVSCLSSQSARRVRLMRDRRSPRLRAASSR